MSTYPFLQDFIKKEETPTPAYVFDLDLLGKHVKKVESGLSGKAELCFAMKANPFLTGAMGEHVPYFEVCSPGEFRICERLGIPMERIVLSGVYKNPEDICEVMDYGHGKGVYTIESRAHYDLLEAEAKKRGYVLKVLIRVTSGNQFGVDEEEIREMVRVRAEHPALQILGLQFYSGTQKKALSHMEKELRHLDEFLVELKEAYEFEAEELEYGPGFFAPYFLKDQEQDMTELLGTFGEILDSLRFSGKVILEMGRYLAYPCGYYLTSIVDKKVNHGQPYAILDGGIHQLNYYGQMMAMKLPYASQVTALGEPCTEGEEESWTLCGSLCTVSDVLVKGYPLHSPKTGDMLIFERTGAYSVTEGINLFLSRPLPAVYFWKEGSLTQVREHIHTDLLNSEAGR